MENLKISLVQLDLVWEEKESNLEKLESIINFNNIDSDIIVFPEMFSTGFSMNPARLAETMDGKTVKWMKGLARKFEALIAGSIIIQENDHYYNRFVAVSKDGIVAQYDKRHLFRMGNEESFYKPGSERVVFEWKGWRILPQICYDIRFPVWIRNAGDYDLALFVANWPKPRREVWNTLLIARALENQAYVAGVNRIGLDNKKIDHAGDSQIIDPKGIVLTSANASEGVITYTLSKEDLISFRDKFPVHLDADDFTIN